MTIIAHLSDSHLDTSTNRLRRFEAVLDAVLELPAVDALLVSGDLVDNGFSEEYAQFFAALPPSVPTLLTAGNHDLATPLETALSSNGRAPVLNTSLDVDNLRLIGLDSHIDHHDEGFLTQETLAFAVAEIEDASGPVVLAMHHPPISVGHAVMDRFGLTNPAELAAIINDHPQVVGLFSGHVHSALSATFAGVPLRGAPGIVSTMRLGSRTDPIADPLAMPGLALHTIDEHGIRTVFHHLSPSVRWS